MILIHSIFQLSPEIALFIALALGTWIGKFKFGKFQLGGVAGALVISVILSQFGVTIDDGIKGSYLLSLFMLLDLRVARNFSVHWVSNQSKR